jgi:hypothetical protein
MAGFVLSLTTNIARVAWLSEARVHYADGTHLKSLNGKWSLAGSL